LRHARGASERERAVALYYAVRDEFRYDPYRIDLSPQGMRASRVLEIGYGWCVTKAALLAAACRAAGIPARMGFADVRNHLSTQRMRETMETDVFTWHGYADLWLEGRWVKATPAFNLSLCERFGLHPLDFDGREDSIYHPFDKSGQRHMEYLLDRGRYEDVPLDRLVADFRVRYPRWLREAGTVIKLAESDFLADVEDEAEPGQRRA
jgi:transglutaminase-like putative cysteine protease